MTDQQARAFQALGQKLASDKSWWGAEGFNQGRDDSSIIRCLPSRDGAWEITVDNAVGVIAVDDLEVIVEPKIPSEHLLYLFAHSSQWPRFDGGEAHLALDASLFELVVEWFLNAVERLMHSGLLLDYREVTDELASVRGQIEPLGTAQAYYSGRLAAMCRFEEFDIDTPLNRVVSAGARAVLRNPLISTHRRRQAGQILARLIDVGPLNLEDLTVRLDRRTIGYRDAISLAKQVLRSQGHDLVEGQAHVQSFLIRTPEMVEEALRNLLAEGLLGRTAVKKTGLVLGSSSMTVNPDLVFDKLAIGDVKYKVNWLSWPRPDLYQSVAFASAYSRPEALIVSLASELRRRLPAVGFGGVTVRHLVWHAVSSWSPEAAAENFKEQARDWWVQLGETPDSPEV